MEQVLTTFGIDWRLLLINAFNFGLLLTVLWYFLYAPIMRMLEDRRTKIASGVKSAEEAEQKLKEISSEKKSILASASHDAEEMLAKAKEVGKHKEQELVKEAHEKSAKIVEEATMRAEDAKRRALAESKEEVARMVVLGAEKILKKS